MKYNRLLKLAQEFEEIVDDKDVTYHNSMPKTKTFEVPRILVDLKEQLENCNDLQECVDVCNSIHHYGNKILNRKLDEESLYFDKQVDILRSETKYYIELLKKVPFYLTSAINISIDGLPAQFKSPIKTKLFSMLDDYFTHQYIENFEQQVESIIPDTDD